MKTSICLFGLSLFNGNKGCEALAYAFLDMLSEIAGANNSVFRIDIFQSFRSDDFPNLPKKWTGLDIFLHRTSHRSKHNRQDLIGTVKVADICFDFTEGDSFSDLYGIRRFISQTLVKTMVIKTKTPFVLGPQTYGPFTHWLCKKWTKWVVLKSYEVFSRDKESASFIERITNRSAIVTTDIAMALNLQGGVLPQTEKIRIGVNISALLWNGGYSGSNQFNLLVNYREYIERLLTNLCSEHIYEIYLIPHVIDSEYGSVEDDLSIAGEIKNKFQQCNLLENVRNPAEIKNLISQMNVFTGARMHATIAAFSTGVPVIPFAYSKKFSDLYDSINYKYVIDGRRLNTDDAVLLTIKYINEKEALAECAKKAFEICEDRLAQFKVKLGELLR